MHRLATLPALTLVLVGCASRPTLSGGDWVAELMGGQSKFSFGNDGSVKMEVGTPVGAIPANGTFSETDQSVAFTVQHVQVPKGLIGQGAKKLVDALVGRPLSFNLTWKSAIEVELSPKIPAGPFGQPMTLKRASP